MRDITRLTDHELLSETELLAARERRITLEVLVHLAEIDRRRLYLPLGYSSLFEYCRRRLHYSESAANRRIRTARCLRCAPELQAMLASGTVTVATVSMIASLLTPDNKADLLAAIADKSQNEVQVIVSTFRAGKPVRDRIKPLTIAAPRGERSPGTRPDDRATRMGPAAEDARTAARTGPAAEDAHTAAPAEPNRQLFDRHSGGKEFATAAAVMTERCFKFEFGAGEDFMNKFTEVKVLLSTKFPAGADLATVFEILMDEYIDRHSPWRRVERRAKRAARRKEKRAHQRACEA